MILDGKNLEVASVPLNRLVEPVFTEEAAYTQQAEDNNRMAAIEDLSLSGDKELKKFHNDTVAHMASHITADPDTTAHIIDDGAISRTMLNNSLSSDLVFRSGDGQLEGNGLAQVITAPKTFNNCTTTFVAPSTSGTAINVTQGQSVLNGPLTVGNSSTKTGGNTVINGTATVNGALSTVGAGAVIDGALTVNGNLQVKGTTTTLNSTETTVKDPVITLNQGGTNAVGCGVEISGNTSVKATIKYSGSGRSGWSTTKAGTSSAAQTLATLDDITAAGGQTSAQVLAAIKTQIIAEVKKCFAGGSGISITSTTAATFQGSTSYREITLPSGFAAKNTDYVVFITPEYTSAQTMGSVGEIQVVNTSATAFRVYNTGTAGIRFSWMAMNAVKMKQYGGASAW